VPNDNVCIAHSSLVLFTRFVFIFDERTHRFLHNLAPTGQTTKPDIYDTMTNAQPAQASMPRWLRAQGDRQAGLAPKIGCYSGKRRLQTVTYTPNLVGGDPGR
jgi:hypothetical protein